MEEIFTRWANICPSWNQPKKIPVPYHDHAYLVLFTYVSRVTRLLYRTRYLIPWWIATDWRKCSNACNDYSVREGFFWFPSARPFVLRGAKIAFFLNERFLKNLGRLSLRDCVFLGARPPVRFGDLELTGFLNGNIKPRKLTVPHKILIMSLTSTLWGRRRFIILWVWVWKWGQR